MCGFVKFHEELHGEKAAMARRGFGVWEKSATGSQKIITGGRSSDDASNDSRIVRPVI